MLKNGLSRRIIQFAGYGLAFGLGFVLALVLKSIPELKPAHRTNKHFSTAEVSSTRVQYPALGPQDQIECAARAEFDELEAAASPRPDIVQHLARRWTAHLPQGPLSIAHLCTLADSLMIHWNYLDEPTGLDELQTASQSIRGGLRGDCEDFAVAGAALVQALGGRVRVVKAWLGNSGHSWLEINLGLGDWDLSPNNGRKLSREGDLTWLRVDWSCRQQACFEPDRGLVFDLSQKSCFTRP